MFIVGMRCRAYANHQEHPIMHTHIHYTRHTHIYNTQPARAPDDMPRGWHGVLGARRENTSLSTDCPANSVLVRMEMLRNWSFVATGVATHSMMRILPPTCGEDVGMLAKCLFPHHSRTCVQTLCIAHYKSFIPKPTTVSRSVRSTMGSPAKMMVYCRAHGSSLYPEMMVLGLLESEHTLLRQSSGGGPRFALFSGGA